MSSESKRSGLRVRRRPPRPPTPVPRRRARRGRPAKPDPLATESGYRWAVEVEVLANPEEANGWTVLATTVNSEVSTDAELLQAYQEQHTTVAPGCRWSKNLAASAPVWLEQPERMAALAMLTVVGLLVYSMIQRQVRLSLRVQAQQVPGNKGATATPTAAVVALFAQVAYVQFWRGKHEVVQIAGVEPHHCCSVMHSGWPSRGMRRPQRTKSISSVRVLERGLYGTSSRKT